jgi:hypothetical protein
MATHTAPSASRHERAAHTGSPVRTAAMVFGVVFLLVGIAGFVPGITQNLDRLEWAGHESGAKLLGIFQVSALHNVVHLLFGVVGIVAARTESASRGFLVVGGIIYAVLFVYGLIVDKGTNADFVPLNRADDWLHLALAAAMVLAGLLPGRTTARRDDDYAVRS